MTTTALKKKLKSLVDEKRSTAALRRIHDLLTDPALEDDSAKALRDRLDRAEADFKAGRVMGADEAKRRLKASLKRHRATQAKVAKRA